MHARVCELTSKVYSSVLIRSASFRTTSGIKVSSSHADSPSTSLPYIGTSKAFEIGNAAGE